LKILHCFNMANDGWSAVKGLRAIGVDAHLVIHRPSHVASLPQWEEAEIDQTRLGDLYDPDWTVLNESWRMPHYVHVWDLRKSVYPLSSTLKWLRRLSDLSRYDVVIGHFPFAKMAPFYKWTYSKPYIIYDAGWIRYLHDKEYEAYASLSYHLARAGYAKATRIFFTNVDTHEIFLKLGYDPQKLVYTPFAIDTELYCPSHRDNSLRDSYHASPVFFMPTRPDPIKGSDLVLLAFQRYLKDQPSALLLLVDWGERQPDYAKQKDLVGALRISARVRWLPVMNKHLLVKYYNIADVVFDNFVRGAFGTLAIEAMSCAKPLVGYAESRLWTQWHDSVPPVANARTEDQIYERMIELEDDQAREEYGKLGRRWVLENCEMRLVAERQLAICEECLRK
jgi:glycosyltransferase involved in cell wall biosynthesis